MDVNKQENEDKIDMSKEENEIDNSEDEEEIDASDEDELTDDDDEDDEDEFTDDDEQEAHILEIETVQDRTFYQVPSLESISLKSIAGDFKRFNLAYSTSDDRTLQCNLRVLQRLYSRYFLLEDKYLDNSYLNFLVNEYLKELDIAILNKCNPDDAVKQIAKVGHSFQKISFNGFRSKSHKEALMFVDQIMYHLHNVEVLNLGKFCSDQTLNIIANSCPQLEVLDLNYSDVTSKGLKMLCSEIDNVVKPKLANLRILSLRNVPEVKDGIGYLLKYMPSLEKVDHDDLADILYSLFLEDSGKAKILDNVRKLNLTTMKFSVCVQIKSDYFRVLKALTVLCPNLKSLEIPIWNNKQLALVCRFPHLEHLDLQDMMRYSDLNSLLPIIGKGFKTLRIFYSSVSIQIMLKSCPNLESLYFEHVLFQPIPHGITDKFYHLTELTVEFSSTDPDPWEYLIKLLNVSPNLRKLSLQHFDFYRLVGVNPEFAQYFKNTSTLKHAVFRYCNIKESLLKSILLTCEPLLTVTLENCIIKCGHTDLSVIENRMSQTIKSGLKMIWIDKPFGT